MKLVNPIFVENVRGDTVENFHRGAAIVVNYRGDAIASWGDVDRPIYARSSIKYLQAIPLVESGAAEAYHLEDQQIALACSSHSGEPKHVELVSQWLRTLGLGQEALRCGPSRPGHWPTYESLIQSRQEATSLHNACSGKHVGFLTTCCHLSYPLEGYTEPNHPFQIKLKETLEDVMCVEASVLPRAVDGCSIPVYAYPLKNIALGMTRLSPKGLGLSKQRKEALTRIREAVVRNPYYVAGTNRLDTLIIDLTQGEILIKAGADGIYAGCIPKKGIGFALKIDDGTPKAAEVALGAILTAFYSFPYPTLARLQPYFKPIISNFSKKDTGFYRIHQGWL